MASYYRIAIISNLTCLQKIQIVVALIPQILIPNYALNYDISFRAENGSDPMWTVLLYTDGVFLTRAYDSLPLLFDKETRDHLSFSLLILISLLTYAESKISVVRRSRRTSDGKCVSKTVITVS